MGPHKEPASCDTHLIENGLAGGAAKLPFQQSPQNVIQPSKPHGQCLSHVADDELKTGIAGERAGKDQP